MMELTISNQSFVSCRRCLALMAVNAGFCADCGNGFDDDAPKTLMGKVKRFLGIEISSEIVTINLDDNRRFFTGQEINELLDLEKMTILGLEDVPDREAMFYQSKRIRKPLSKNKS